MRIKYADSDTIYSHLRYEGNRFIISDNDDKNQIECTPVLEVANEYDPKNYQLIILHNERDDYSENSIYPVKVIKEKEGTRIGWIFPFQSLISADHDFTGNQFFLRYAYVAYHLLLERIEIKDGEEKGMQPEAIFLEDFYSDDIVLLVIDNDNVKSIGDFSINDYVVDLYRKGYAFNGKGNLISEIEKPEKVLNLKKIAPALKGFSGIINEIFKDSVSRQYDIEFARFFAYYQVIEILISAVFNCKFTQLVTTINIDKTRLFDERDTLNDMINERKRVKWLFSNFTNVSSKNTQVLEDNCKKILDRYGKKSTDTVAENFYSVRCLLVHELYNVKSDTDSFLKELNDSLLDILLEMIFTFKASEEP